MSAVSGLLVPNNFDIFVRSINVSVPGASTASALFSASGTNTINVSNAATPTNGQVLTATSGTTATWQTPAAPPAQSVTPTNSVVFTNKTLTDISNSVAAEFLFSGSKTNLVNVSNSPNPLNGQVLTATSGTTASWQTPSHIPSWPNQTYANPQTTISSAGSFPIIATVLCNQGDGSYYIGGYITSHALTTFANPISFEIIGMVIVSGGVITYAASTLGSSSGLVWTQNPTASASGVQFRLTAGDNTLNVKWNSYLFSIYTP